MRELSATRSTSQMGKNNQRLEFVWALPGAENLAGIFIVSLLEYPNCMQASSSRPTWMSRSLKLADDCKLPSPGVNPICCVTGSYCQTRNGQRVQNAVPTPHYSRTPAMIYIMEGASSQAVLSAVEGWVQPALGRPGSPRAFYGARQ